MWTSSSCWWWSGEFNAGKSAFINALLGQSLLEEGATAHHRRASIASITANQISRTVHEADLEVITAPVDWLRDLNIVDTPGANAVIQRHQEITEDFVPRSDLVLFVTSADRPFSESERLFMERVRQWGKKVVIVVNKVDILNDADIARVRAFVADNAVKLLGVEPPIFLVSAKLAQRAKFANQSANLPTSQSTNLPILHSTNLPTPQPTNLPTILELWSASRFEPLERYILDTLDQQERLRLKLLSPLGVAGQLRDQVRRGIAATRLEILADDLSTIDDGGCATWPPSSGDMRRDFQYRLGQIDATLYAMGDRGIAFIDQWLRIGRVFDLANSAKVREGLRARGGGRHQPPTGAPDQRSDRLDGGAGAQAVARGDGLSQPSGRSAQGSGHRRGGRQLREQPPRPAGKRAPRHPTRHRRLRSSKLRPPSWPSRCRARWPRPRWWRQARWGWARCW
ncbi:MAG: dynamin family protein [Anaerolineae bacterium]